tara:strand:- start:114 stop:710 length:597 start_codon:yes stop_codon:yes gene_type:complete
MAYRREDRVNLHKLQVGVSRGEPAINDLSKGVPEFRSFIDTGTGEEVVAQYVRNENSIYKSTFAKVGLKTSALKGDWYIGDEVDLTSVTKQESIRVNKGTFVLDIRMLITTAITVGSSMEINIGDNDDGDFYVDGWNGSTGSVAVNSILGFGIADAISEMEITGKVYTSANTLNVRVINAADAGAVKLLAFLIENPLY